MDNTSVACPNLKHIREFTLERNLMDVISVDSTYLKCPTLKNTREFTLEGNPMDVISVDDTSLMANLKKTPDNSHWRETLWIWSLWTTLH